MRWASAAVAVVFVALCGHASAAWEQPVGGASPINNALDGYAEGTSLLGIGGVPYVAWDEYDGTVYEIRVARLNATGTDWEEVGTQDNPASPINNAADENAYEPSMTSINGVPYLAWHEDDGVRKIRVARLNDAGTGWDRVGQSLDASTPINQASNQGAFEPSMTAIEGVPYVAWREGDGTNSEMRVARLNAAGTGWDKVGQAVNPASPINRSSSRDAFYPDIVGFGGVPHVAWAEEDGTNREIRVARLDAAGTEWEMVGAQLSPASPINQSNGALATEPSLASINDSLYVAWNEADGVGAQVRVARLNAAGTAWEKVGQSLNAASPINASPSGTTTEVDLSSFDGIPYVAWTERDAANVAQVRVARLNQAGTGWERIADSASPINDAPTGGAFDPSLASVGGVPFVGWAEDDGDVGQLRVARLEPEFLGQSATAADTTAALSATWHTYGLPYPLGFDYGANLEQSTALTPATVGQDTVTVEHQVGGLTPATAYSVRPFATAGVPAPRLLGETGSFATAPDTTPPETTITKDPKNKLKKAKAKYRFVSSEPGSTFRCKFDKRKFKPCDAGKAKYKRLDDGKHKFKVYAVDPAGNRDPSPDKDKFKVR